MDDNLPTTRAQQVQTWADLALDRAGDEGADIGRWSSIAGRLYHAGELYERSLDDQAQAVVDGVVRDLIRGDR